MLPSRIQQTANSDLWARLLIFNWVTVSNLHSQYLDLNPMVGTCYNLSTIWLCRNRIQHLALRLYVQVGSGCDDLFMEVVYNGLGDVEEARTSSLHQPESHRWTSPLRFFAETFGMVCWKIWYISNIVCQKNWLFYFAKKIWYECQTCLSCLPELQHRQISV